MNPFEFVIQNEGLTATHQGEDGHYLLLSVLADSYKNGTALVNDIAALVGDTNIGVDTVDLEGTEIPVGARFTIAGETGSPIHRVTARTPASGPTTSIDFTPALASGVADNAVVSFVDTYDNQYSEVIHRLRKYRDTYAVKRLRQRLAARMPEFVD